MVIVLVRMIVPSQLKITVPPPINASSSPAWSQLLTTPSATTRPPIKHGKIIAAKKTRSNDHEERLTHDFNAAGRTPAVVTRVIAWQLFSLRCRARFVSNDSDRALIDAQDRDCRLQPAGWAPTIRRKDEHRFGDHVGHEY